MVREKKKDGESTKEREVAEIFLFTQSGTTEQKESKSMALLKSGLTKSQNHVASCHAPERERERERQGGKIESFISSESC